MRIGSTPSKDPLKEMNVRHIPNKDKRATSSFGKSAKVCFSRNTTGNFHCFFIDTQLIAVSEQIMWSQNNTIESALWSLRGSLQWSLGVFDH